MNSKSKKQSSFSKKSIENKLKELGYVNFLKSISPFYNDELEDIKHSLRFKHLEVLVGLNPPKKEVLKELIHYFAGYDKNVSGLLLLHCAHKIHRYKCDLVPFLLEKVDSVRSNPIEREEYRIQFLKDSSDLALELFKKTKDKSESFIFGVDVVSFLEKRIISQQKTEKDSGIKKLPLKKEKPKNCFQNGFEKFIAPKRRTIVRSINYKKKPKRIYQKILSN